MFIDKFKEDVLNCFTLSELKFYIAKKLQEEVEVALTLVYCDNNEFIYKKIIDPELLDKLIGVVLDDTIIYIEPFICSESVTTKFDKVNGYDFNLIMPNDLFEYPQDAYLMTEREKDLIYGDDKFNLHQVVTLLKERDVEIKQFVYNAPACIVPHSSDQTSILIYFPATGMTYSPIDFYNSDYHIPICSKIK
jgi:hypothetical protein